ncbi:hypothetical protein AB4Y85_13885 [Microvirga sp. 2YAF29]|uniref:hypothetical protein n=1 Tax=Microvirga sp. 2YAF29 TaxID=3233031 RepID=UPI003F9CF55D
MKVHAFTSFSYAYLDRARVLAHSIRRVHPEWTLWAILVDQSPPDLLIDWRQECFDHVIRVDELLGAETERWIFGLDVVEACTAIKGRALDFILRQPDVDQVLYFDPDIAVFSRMDEAVDRLASHSIILTPHQVDPEARADHQAILDNEVGSLLHGVFNLGFIGVSNSEEGRRFASWWRDRLDDWCHERHDIGLFVDQKWCNLIPCFFDNFSVLRDPGYNVASWNLSKRHISIDEAGYLNANGSSLKFYHFTKYGPVGALMTERYASANSAVQDLWWWYGRALASESLPIPLKGWWYYGQYADGSKIPKSARELYRSRPDLQLAFPRPFEVGEGSFHDSDKRFLK